MSEPAPMTARQIYREARRRARRAAPLYLLSVFLLYASCVFFPVLLYRDVLELCTRFGSPSVGSAIVWIGFFLAASLVHVVLYNWLLRARTEREAWLIVRELGIECCPLCGYYCAGLSEPRCPECGSRFVEHHG